MTNTISSRTPEGSPNLCPVCGAIVRIEPTLPTGDAPCPQCGTLLWFTVFDGELQLFDAVDASNVRHRLQDVIAKQLGVAADRISASTRFAEELGADSLDTVELVMLFEEQFDLDLPDAEAEKIQTIGQAIAYILRQRRGEGPTA
jgi:acyl carrier protein